MAADRDLVGYAGRPPHPQWPGGARVAVSFVLNVEEGSERSVLSGDPASETFLSEIIGAPAFPDRHMSMESLYEYGSRAGFWRVMDAFAEADLPLTIFGVAQAMQLNPAITAAVLDAGHEVASHGLRWISYQEVDLDTERAHLAEAVRILTELCGTAPLGWYTGRDSPNTRELVVEHGGFLYDSDSYADDLPYWTTVAGTDHLVVPYTLDTNDMRFATPQGFNTGDQFFTYCRDAFDALYREGETAPKMLSIGLHGRIIGRPARIDGLRRLIAHVTAHDDVWVCRRREIAQHWIDTVPARREPGGLMDLGPIDPPERLLMGPGPINADPRVLQAMAAPLVGQFDPFMTQTMAEASALYREVFRTANEATLLIDGTARAGVEAALVSILAPGDRVVVPSFGRFGHLLVEIAERCGATVTTVEAPWGEVVPVDEIASVVEAVEPKLVAIVQGDTSTTMCQPLDGLGAICHQHGALLYADVTASLGGNAFEMDGWQLDAASAGLQKCLGGPSGSAPLTLSPAAVTAIRARSSVEAGLVDGDEQRPSGDRIRSNYFDLGMILDYWGPRRLNHHTEATSMLYAARERARLLVLEGMDEAVDRHRRNGVALAAGLQALGLELYGDQAHRMHNVVAASIPDGVDGEAVRANLLTSYGIEIGTSFGPLHGKVWRVGTMGANARPDAVLRTLAALEAVLRGEGQSVPEGAGVDAANDQYAIEEAP